jgi:NAD(P)H-flavin reductase
MFLDRFDFCLATISGKSVHMANHVHRGKTVTIEGPYGCMRPLRQFDSIVLFAGSTGATFTFPLLRDIMQGWRENTAAETQKSRRSLFGRQPGAVTRHVRFVWVVKSRAQLGWLSEQLSSMSTEFQELQDKLRDIKLELTVYVTCDESFTREHNSLLSAVTAPKHNTSAEKAIEHGLVQYRDRSFSRGEKTVHEEKAREVKETTTKTPANSTCCCRAEVDEQAPSDSIALRCCCQTSQKRISDPQTSRPASIVSASPRSSLNSKLLTPTNPKFLVHPSITIYTGRPKTRDIIRRSLEQALGESAVVVCGPQGLVADVKQDVCSLSDERAVHKGTGAQGIYLHTESFGY